MTWFFKTFLSLCMKKLKHLKRSQLQTKHFLNFIALGLFYFKSVCCLNILHHPFFEFVNIPLQVAQKPFQTLSHIFAKPKDPVLKEQRTDAVYSIPCNDCDHEYIGQTKRQLGTRLKEHQKAVFLCKKENSALSEHACQTNHTIAWDNSKIITTNRRYHQRLCLEAWHINSAHAPLNRDDGGLLPDTYLHLIKTKGR